MLSIKYMQENETQYFTIGTVIGCFANFNSYLNRTASSIIYYAKINLFQNFY